MSDDMNEMNASSWIIILTLVTSPFIAFAIISCIISCFACNPEGCVVMRKSGPCMRRKVAESSLVTTTVRRIWDYRMCPCCLANPPAHDPRIATEESQGSVASHDIVGLNGEDYSKCPVCLEPFKLGQSVSFARNTMYCNHCFHTDCIKRWLIKKTTCPCCRQNIVRWEDLFVRCKSWNTLYSKRSRRIALLIKQHRDLLAQCRETGKFCINHGLRFPYERPILEPPYEPRTREMLEMLVSCGEVPRLRNGITSQLRRRRNITNVNNDNNHQSSADVPRLTEMRRERGCDSNERSFPTIRAVDNEIPAATDEVTLMRPSRQNPDLEQQSFDEEEKIVRSDKRIPRRNCSAEVLVSNKTNLPHIKRIVDQCDESTNENISTKELRHTDVTLQLDDSKISSAT